MIFAHLIHAVSILSTDASALESSISALERAISALESEIKALDSSSVPWERSLPLATAVVVVGLLMEFWIIWRENRDEWHAFGLGIVRLADKPSTGKYVIELVSVLFITAGVFGEFAIGLEIASINKQLRGKSAELRTKNGELRTKSDKLVGLLHAETENEHIARVEAEEAVAWRRLTPSNRQKLRSELSSFTINRAWFQYNSNDIEAFDFGSDLAASLPASWNPTEPEPVMSMREGPVKLGTKGPLQRGIRVAASGDKTYGKAADILAKLISSFGFDCERSKTALVYNPQYAPMIVVTIDPRPEGSQGEAKLRREARRKQAKSSQSANP